MVSRSGTGSLKVGIGTTTLYEQHGLAWLRSILQSARSSTSMANPITASQPLRQYATTNSFAGSMHSDLSFEDGNTALNEWYRLFLVPGAAHWSPSPTQPNGLFPQTNPEVPIDPVENGVATAALNASRRWEPANLPLVAEAALVWKWAEGGMLVRSAFYWYLAVWLQCF